MICPLRVSCFNGIILSVKIRQIRVIRGLLRTELSTLTHSRAPMMYHHAHTYVRATFQGILPYGGLPQTTARTSCSPHVEFLPMICFARWRTSQLARPTH